MGGDGSSKSSLDRDGDKIWACQCDAGIWGTPDRRVGTTRELVGGVGAAAFRSSGWCKGRL